MTREQLWKWWYDNQLEFTTEYQGVPLVKNPLDLWQYRAIIDETHPDTIIETGTFMGGSAVWLADQFDGNVISIDLESDRPLPHHDRVEFVCGASSVDPGVTAYLNRAVTGRCMVILDSDHSKDHVLAELERYAPLVTVGCYLIVEDTNPFAYKGPAGPAQAIRAFQPGNKGFECDKSREQYVLTSHPGGYFRRVR